MAHRFSKSVLVRAALLGALALFLALFLLAAAGGIHQSILFDTEETRPLNNGWQWQQPDGSWQSLTLPTRLGRIGPTLTLRCTLPEDLPIPTVLCFRASHQTVEVFEDDQLLYSFGLEDSRNFGKTPGSGWHMVRLTENSSGHQIALRMTTPYPSYQGYAPEMLLGSKAALLFHLLNLYLPAFVLTSLIFTLGVVLLLIYLFLVRRTETTKEILYLGSFAVLIALWMYGESRMVQFFMGNQFLSMCTTFLAMMLAPIPVFKYICCFKDFRYSRMLHLLCGLLYGTLVVSCTLQWLNLYDFIEMLPFLHLILFASVALALLLLFTDWLRNRNPNMRNLAISLCILCLFAGLELPGIYIRNGQPIGNFMRLGVLLFIAVQASVAMQQFNQLVRLSRVAGLDALTGCKNRTAYMQQLNRLGDSNQVLVIMIDLNDLKSINDQLGHLVGDDALVRCGQVFQKTFGPWGDCYRIGGDEFVFLGRYMGHRRLHLLLTQLEAHCAQQRQQVSYPFSMAYGYCIFKPGRGNYLCDAVRRADRMMYRVKQKQKK